MSGPALTFTTERFVEELYNTAAVPHQTRNLAQQSRTRARMGQMRCQLIGHMRQDLGLLPEAELF